MIWIPGQKLWPGLCIKAQHSNKEANKPEVVKKTDEFILKCGPQNELRSSLYL